MCFTSTWDYGRQSSSIGAVTTDKLGNSIIDVDDFYRYDTTVPKSPATGYETVDSLVVLVTETAHGDYDLVFLMEASCPGTGAGTYCYNRTEDTYSATDSSCANECTSQIESMRVFMNLNQCNGTNCEEPFLNSGMSVLISEIEGDSLDSEYVEADDCYSASTSACSDVTPDVDTISWESCTAAYGDVTLVSRDDSAGFVLGHVPKEAFCLRVAQLELDLVTSSSDYANVVFISESSPGVTEAITVPVSELGGSWELCARPCIDYCSAYADSCSSCTLDPRCGWDSTSESCVAGNAAGPTSGSPDSYSYSCCGECSEALNCYDCTTSSSGCGWCASTGQCMSGSSLGGCEGSCELFTTSSTCVFPSANVTADVASPPTGRTVLTDSFSSTLTGWTATSSASVSGSWQISAGSLLASQVNSASGDPWDDMSSGSMLLNSEDMWTDMGLSLNFVTESRDYVGIVLRFVDESNFYIFEWAERSDGCCDCDYRTRRIRKIQGGTITTLAEESVGFITDWVYSLKSFVYEVDSGTQIDIFIDNTHIFSALDTDSLRPRTGSFGPFAALTDTSTVSFDDVSVVLITTPVLASSLVTVDNHLGWGVFEFDSSTISEEFVLIRAKVSDPESDSTVSLYASPDIAFTSGSSDLTYNSDYDYGLDFYYTVGSSPLYIRVYTESLQDITVDILPFDTLDYTFATDLEITAGAFFTVIDTVMTSSSYTSVEYRITPEDDSVTTFDCTATDITTGAVITDSSESGYCSLVFTSLSLSGDYRLTVSLRSGLDDVLAFTLTTVLPSPVAALSATVSDTDSTPLVLLTGTNFGSTSGAVTLDSVSLTIDSWKSGSVKVRIPEGQGEDLEIVLTTSLGQDSNTMTFSYNAPEVDTVTPSSGTTAGDFDVIISGSNFGVSGATVSIAGKDCPLNGTYTHSEITCTVAAGFGSGDVIVTVDGQSSDAGVAFTYLPPVVTGMSPTSGPTSGTTELVFTGTDLAGYSVSASGCEPDLDQYSISSLVCVLDAGEGTGRTISVSFDSTPPKTYSFSFSYNAPSISEFSPTTSDSHDSAVFTITGNNFGSSPSVSIGGVDVDTLSLISHTRLKGVIPAGGGANKNVVVTTSTGREVTSLAAFSYNPPRIDEISPLTLPTTGGVITVSGASFGLSGTVTVGSLTCSVSSWTNSSVVCSVPAAAGKDLLVVVKTELQTSSESILFSYEEPVLSGTSTTFGTLGGKTAIFSGENFGPALVGGSSYVAIDSIYIGDQLCPESSIASSHGHTSFKCTYPPGQGTVDVNITVKSQPSNTISVTYSPPEIDTVYGSLASTGGGSDLTLEGSNLGTYGQVTVGGKVCESTSWTDTTIVCELPAGSGTSNVISVDVSDQIDNSKTYAYGSPTITGISGTPVSTATIFGENITLTGTNMGLGVSTSVTFNSVPVPLVYSVSHTELAFTVPEGSGTGNSFSLSVDGQSASCSVSGGCVVAYDIPRISLIRGCEIDGTSTGSCTIYGGTNLTITGTSLGLATSESTSLTTVDVGGYDCPVHEIAYADVDGINHQIICGLAALSVPVDSAAVTVTVDSQVSVDDFSITFSGPAVVPSSLRVCTDGAGDGLLTDLPATGDIDICFTMTTLNGADETGVSVAYGGTSFDYVSGGAHWFECGSVVVSSEVEIQCTLSPGMGADLILEVTVLGIPVYSSASSNAISYTTPAFVADSIRSTSTGTGSSSYTASTSNSEVVYFEVDDLDLFSNPALWDLVTILYGTAEGSKDYRCTSFAMQSGTTASCTTSQGEGVDLVFELHALNSVSSESAFTFNYPQVPQILSVSGCVDDVPTGSTYDCPSSGETTLTISGLYFCDFSPSKNCSTSFSIGSDECSSLSYVSDTKFTCTLPAGTGLDVPSVFVQSTGTVTSVASRVHLISYKAPIVTGFTGCTTCSRVAYTPITLSGSNFGYTGSIVTAGNALCVNVTHDSSTPHTKVSCMLPPGSGTSLSLALYSFAGVRSTVDGVLSYEQCTAGSYDNGGCDSCDAGKFSSDLASECIDCVAGFYSEAGQGSCDPCELGYYSNVGAEECTPCSTGYFADTKGSASCQLCSPGTFASSNATVECTPAPVGTFVSSFGANEASPCENGTYTDSQSSIICQDCSAGEYSQEGASDCTVCDAGRFSASIGTAECSNCLAGKASGDTGSTVCPSCYGGFHASTDGLEECQQCAPGYYSLVSDTGGVVDCSPCAAGYYAPDSEMSSCLKCPLGTSTSATGMSECTPCDEGYYASSEGSLTCRGCPTGKYSLGTGNFECTQCAPGRVSDSSPSSSCDYCSVGESVFEQGQTDCLACSPGSASSSSGSFACTECLSGFVAQGSSESECTECLAGYYSSSTSSCDICLKGTYSAYDGAGSCDPCPAGYHSEFDGSVECDACLAGYASGSSGSTSCDLCEAGKYSAYRSTLCTDCPAGSVSESDGSGRCTSCPAGRSQSTSGQATCDICGIGEYSAFAGSTSCSLCPSGSVSASSSESIECIDCPAGQFLDSDLINTCSNCSAGFYSSSSGSSECEPCLAGYSSSPGSSACDVCEAGKHSSAESAECTDCSPGEYAGSQGLESCTVCDPGRFAEFPGSNECLACDVGTYSPTSGAAGCTPCSIGRSARYPGSATCEVCSSGTVASTTGSVLCDSCPKGTSSSDGLTCTNCTAGSFSSTKGRSTCSPCEPGTYSEYPGATACTSCLAGFVTEEYGLEECTPCEMGTYARYDGSSECLECSAGSFSNTSAADSCIPCSKGFAAESTGLSECEPCSKGLYQENEGQVVCDLCLEGTSAASTGATFCEECQVGKYSDSTGGRRCKSCSTGRFSDAIRTQKCTDCAVGTYAPYLSTLECTKCEAGYYQNEEKSDECKPCSIGFYADSTGFSTCIGCSSGTFADSVNSTICSDCLPGTYQSAVKSDKCEPCLPGSYATGLQNSQCTPCAAGKYSEFGEAATCDNCPAGYAQSESGQSGCTICEPGFAATEGLAECTPCGDSAVAVGQGFASCRTCPSNSSPNGDYTRCLCNSGYLGYTERELYNLDSDSLASCEKCAAGADCERVGTTFSSIETAAGYWSTDPSSLVFYQCQIATQCLGGYTSTCSDHRTGPVCGLCEEGYEAFGSDCTLCSSQRSSTIASGVILLLITLGFVLIYWLILRVDDYNQWLIVQYREAKWDANNPDSNDLHAHLHFEDLDKKSLLENHQAISPQFVFKIKILVGFVQIAAGIALSLDTPWPTIFKEFLSYSFTYFDIVTWARIACVYEVDFYDKHLVSAALPIFIPTVLATLYLLPRAVSKVLHGSSVKYSHALEDARLRYVKLVVVTMFILYPSVSGMMFKLYDCEDIDGVLYLWADLSIQCSGDKYFSRALLNIAFVALYSIGIPLALYFALHNNRRHLKHPKVNIKYGFLYTAYQEEYYWFDMIDMIHKVFITSLCLFIPAAYQLMIAMIVLVIYLFVLVAVSPYIRHSDNRLHQLVQV